MYVPQAAATSLRATDYIDDENVEAELIGNLAEDIAQRQQGWVSVDQLSGEDITLLSKTPAGLRAPSISKLRRANSSIITAVLDVVNKVGLHYSVALRAILDAGSEPKPKLPPSAEVDIPSELKNRPTLRGLGRLLLCERAV